MDYINFLPICVSLRSHSFLFLGRWSGGPLESKVTSATLLGVLEIKGAPAYRGHRLLESRWRSGGLQYLVDWEECGPEECSWVLARDVLSQKLVDEFHAFWPDRLAPHPRHCP